MTTREDVKNQIINWAVNFPVDRIWRKKYNIPFGSTAHREVSFIDQLIDIEEDKFFEELYSREEYVPNVGDWLKTDKDIENCLEDSIQNLRDEFKDIDTK